MANSSFFDFHCEAGAEWYACASGSKFVGCCAADPCSNGCAQGSIRPGEFNITHHGEFPDASCGAASNFWSCIAGPSFWGCCKSNPCSTGICPQGDLVPAFMDRPEQLQAYASASSTADASATSTASASASPTADSSSKSNTGAIVGGVVGGVFVIGIIGAFILFFLRRRRNRKREEGYMGSVTMVPMMNAEKHDENRNSMQYDGRSPPPTYSSPEQNYQQGFPAKGQHSFHQFASHASEPQELPADFTPPRERYSELPADISQGVDNRRFSELPAGAKEPARPSELESPEISPRPQQTEFSNDMAKRTGESGGLGIS